MLSQFWHGVRSLVAPHDSSLDSLLSEGKPLFDQEGATRQIPCRHAVPRTTTILLLCSNTFFILATAIFAVLYTTRHDHCHYDNGFSTDIADARPAVFYEERNFTGAWKFNSTTLQPYRDIDLSETQYFGFPSPALDDAWDDLLRGEFVPMTDDEIEPFGDALTRVFGGRPHMEPAVFHALHCVNKIRRALDEDYYSASKTSHERGVEDQLGPKWKRDHTDHCLDMLFQEIKCHGDLTPSPLYASRGFPAALGITGTHTCRNFDAIRAWMDGRAKDPVHPTH